MCGRYRLSNCKRFEELNEVRLGAPFLPNFNVAPTQTVPVVLDQEPDLLQGVRWGLVPFWAKDVKVGAKMINARAETVATTNAFKVPFRKRRCLVPAEAFYEWMKVGTQKVPHHILMKDGEPFAFAGLWETWRDPTKPDAEPLRSCTIITTTANSLVEPIHDRMPVILPRDAYRTWLDRETSPEQCTELLKPYSPELMQAHPISSRVNSPKNNDASLLEAIPVNTL